MRLSLISEDDTATCIACAGNVSQSHFGTEDANPLEALLGAGCYNRRVVLDLGGAELIDSSGLGWLMGCHRRCVAEGGKLILHSVPPMIDQVMRLVRFNTVITIKPDRAEALAAAAAARGTV